MAIWDDEPKQVDCIDDVTGYPIALRRGPCGHWCGYIGVPADHPWHGKDYDHRQPMPTGWMNNHEASVDELGIMNLFCADPEDLESAAPLTLLVRCHGGLTYAAEGGFINNAAATWWFGFDCAHAGDLCPKYDQGSTRGDVYRTAVYVEEQARKAAKDIALFAKAGAAQREHA